MIVLLLLLLVSLSFSTARLYFKSRNALAKREEIKKELAELEKRRGELEKDVSRLQTESGMEEEIRKRLNAQRPGEKTLVIVDKGVESVKIESDNKIGDFFSKILEWVKNKF